MQRTSGSSLSTLFLISCLGLCASCGDSSSTGVPAGTYAVVGGSCRFVVDGTPELADLPYEISVRSPEDSSLYPEGCVARATLRTETCGPSCAPTTCEACLVEGGSEYLLTRAFEDESIQACSSLEWRGGIGSDLLFHGAIVDGSFYLSDVGDYVLGLTARGEASYGISGEDLPAELTCNLTASLIDSR